MPRNIRNTRRNFARPSDSVTPAATAGALGDSSGYPGSTIGITKTSNPVGPIGTGVYTVTSVPSGLSGSLTTSASTGTISFSAPASGSSTAYDIYVSDTNYNGAGKPVKVTNSLTVPAAFQASILVIAGGGAGGWAQGGDGGAGGGGGGGYREFSGYNLLSSTNYTVTVGAGGAVTSTSSANGEASIFSGVTASGGGAGGRVIGGSAGNGAAGGSGGGGAGRNGTAGSPGTATTITAYPTLELYSIQGFAGGTSPNPGMGSAGGGASAVGGAAGSGGGGNANSNHRNSSINGTSTSRAGGGGGGGTGGGGTGSGGSGNGGNSNTNGSAGTANTGGGGGGACSNPNDKTGGAGGSGVVILRYLTASGTITIGAGLTGTTATDGSYKVTTITAGTGNVSWA